MITRTTADYCADMHARSVIDTQLTRTALCAVFVAVVLVGSVSQILSMFGL
jgi:hypothetical protein